MAEFEELWSSAYHFCSDYDWILCVENEVRIHSISTHDCSYCHCSLRGSSALRKEVLPRARYLWSLLTPIPAGKPVGSLLLVFVRLSSALLVSQDDSLSCTSLYLPWSTLPRNIGSRSIRFCSFFSVPISFLQRPQHQLRRLHSRGFLLHFLCLLLLLPCGFPLSQHSLLLCSYVAST